MEQAEESTLSDQEIEDAIVTFKDLTKPFNEEWDKELKKLQRGVLGLVNEATLNLQTGKVEHKLECHLILMGKTDNVEEIHQEVLALVDGKGPWKMRVNLKTE